MPTVHHEPKDPTVARDRSTLGFALKILQIGRTPGTLGPGLSKLARTDK
jgi:hypothetical protein